MQSASILLLLYSTYKIANRELDLQAGGLIFLVSTMGTHHRYHQNILQPILRTFDIIRPPYYGRLRPILVHDFCNFRVYGGQLYQGLSVTP